MNFLLAIAVGGASGALLRYGLSGLIQKLAPGPFPWGTVTVNVIGSLLMGMGWEYLNRAATWPVLRGFVMVGLLGAFTTFSTFSLETAMLARLHDMRMALMNVFVTNAACIAAALVGINLARWVLAAPVK